MKTQTIAGHEITLEEGTRYIASRPFAERCRKLYPVKIQSISSYKPPHTIVIDDLAYDQAVELVNTFNNGVTSFDGRVW